MGAFNSSHGKSINFNYNAKNISDYFSALISFYDQDYTKGKEAGFSFFVSPGIVVDLVKNKVRNYIPGAETISEFIFLLENGYSTIKFFPANLAGGEKKLISIQSILKEANFIPTGGINLKSYKNFISLKNVLCVGMSKFDE